MLFANVLLALAVAGSVVSAPVPSSMELAEQAGMLHRRAKTGAITKTPGTPIRAPAPPQSTDPKPKATQPPVEPSLADPNDASFEDLTDEELDIIPSDPSDSFHHQSFFDATDLKLLATSPPSAAPGVGPRLVARGTSDGDGDSGHAHRVVPKLISRQSHGAGVPEDHIPHSSDDDEDTPDDSESNEDGDE